MSVTFVVHHSKDEPYNPTEQYYTEEQSCDNQEPTQDHYGFEEDTPSDGWLYISKYIV